MLEKHLYNTRKKITAQLTKSVKGLTPQLLATPDMQTHIRTGYEIVYTAVTTGIIFDIESTESSREEATMHNAVTLKEFVRTILTEPLPKERVLIHYDGNALIAPLDVQIADEISWEEKLSGEQKEILSEILGIDLLTAQTYVPGGNLAQKTHIIHQKIAPMPITVESQNILIESSAFSIEIEIPEVGAIPILIWSPDHGVVISFYPTGIEETNLNQELLN